MPKIIFTTCGTSLLTSSCCWGITGIKDLAADNLKGDRVALANDMAVNEGILRNYLQKNMSSELAGSFNDTFNMENLTNIPAEIASLKAISGREGGIQEGDNIILLHSSNDEGMFCAKVVESIINDKSPLQIGQVSVERLEIPGLDHSTAESFVAALGTMWLAVTEKINGCQEPVIFNLTGGYKAMAISLAAYVALRNTTHFRIVYLYESVDIKDICTMYFTNGAIQSGLVPVKSNSPLFRPLMGGLN